MENKKYYVNLPYGGVYRTISKISRVELLFLSENDKNELLWNLITYYKQKEGQHEHRC